LFDGFNLSDRKLKVDKARPREERPFNRYDNDKGQGQGRGRDRNRRGGGKTRRY